MPRAACSEAETAVLLFVPGQTGCWERPCGAGEALTVQPQCLCEAGQWRNLRGRCRAPVPGCLAAGQPVLAVGCARVGWPWGDLAQRGRIFPRRGAFPPAYAPTTRIFLFIQFISYQ